MDYRLEQMINGPAGSHPVWDIVMKGAAGWGEPVFIVLVVIWFLVGWLAGRTAERPGAVAALLAAASALSVNQIVNHLWLRPRPFIAHPNTVHLLLRSSSDASFPSDHAAAAFAIAAVIASFHPKLGALPLLFAALMSYARVYVGDHYPGDVAAGAVIGVLAGAALVTWLSVVPQALTGLGDKIILALHLPLPVPGSRPGATST
ncbi:MAG: phosphatase PAP2 family protein [Chloroflexota bacterium]